jgi:Fic family protein
VLPVSKGKVFRSDQEKAEQEARNGTIQAAFVFEKAASWPGPEAFTPELIRQLHERAIINIYRCAGAFRDGSVHLEGESKHSPPDHSLVLQLIGEMCEYVQSNWHHRPTTLAAYVLWRLNWIHPFFGGNGRTARAASYLVLCGRSQMVLPANEHTIPALLDTKYRDDYYAALAAADRSVAAPDDDAMDLSEMEELLSTALAEQLVAVFDSVAKPKPTNGTCS